MLPTAALDYDLPAERIARHPVEPRDAARLLVVSRSDPARLEHRCVRDLPELLGASDMLVVNDSKVIPARLTGARSDTGGKVEGLFLGLADDVAVPRDEGLWRIMLRAKRPRIGSRVDLTDTQGLDVGVSLRLLARTTTHTHEREAEAQLGNAAGSGGAGESGEDTAAWIARVEDVRGGAVGGTSVEILQRVGSTPLPPYIRSQRKADADAGDDRADRAVYQTVYADEGKPGSVAAPTAGLHFTPGLLATLAARGVTRQAVTLHVGLGTFKPVETEFVEHHPIHAEWCEVPAATAAALVAARAPGTKRRVFAVGTTSARTLESFSSEAIAAAAKTGQAAGHWTRLLITPGYRWQHVEGMLTNFHLPCSSLMAMIASVLDDGTGSGAGVARLQGIYREAIAREYRFYSFGDAMLILP
ncbi:MAG: S-adenosylmethionine:tRNA ribosyltransferase-isomerase [Phycisphaerales bacterium]|nr:S-adenosylmethionine:tRNA ribosyltransferase-isomerase [Phycisphaerales bacterium]